MTGSFSNPGANEITFDCPKCGVPYKIAIFARMNGVAKDGIWSWTGVALDYSDFTVAPSIHNHTHGRKKDCGWHGWIQNGLVMDT